MYRERERAIPCHAIAGPSQSIFAKYACRERQRERERVFMLRHVLCCTRERCVTKHCTSSPLCIMYIHFANIKYCCERARELALHCVVPSEYVMLYYIEQNMFGKVCVCVQRAHRMRGGPLKLTGLAKKRTNQG